MCIRDRLTAIEKEAAKAGIVQDVLLEVNIGGEASKSGVSPEQLWPLLDAAADPAKKARMEQAAYETVIHENTWDALADRFLKGYETR